MKRWLWLSAALVLLDQATKWLVLSMLQPYETVGLLPNLNLTLAFNTGAAFSFLAQAGGWQRWALAGVAILVTGVLAAWLLRLPPREKALAAALALIIGGALGNLIDRVWFGHVVDFIQVYVPWIPFAIFNPWPAFNVADSAITVGVVMLLTHSLLAGPQGPDGATGPAARS